MRIIIHLLNSMVRLGQLLNPAGGSVERWRLGAVSASERARPLEVGDAVRDVAAKEHAEPRSLRRERDRLRAHRLSELVRVHGDRETGGQHCRRDGRDAASVRRASCFLGSAKLEIRHQLGGKMLRTNGDQAEVARLNMGARAASRHFLRTPRLRA
jgi:hypothetical protein